MKFICILPLFCQNALNEHPELHASVWASELQGVERGSEVIAHLLQRSWGSSAEKLSIYCREVCDFLCSCFFTIRVLQVGLSCQALPMWCRNRSAS